MSALEGILTDEVGIEFALLGKYRARARYRPVYLNGGDALHPVAVQGELALTLDNRDVPVEAVLGGAPSAAARQALDLLVLTLILRNHARSDAEALELFVDLPASTGKAAELAFETLEQLSNDQRPATRTTVFSSCAGADHAARLRRSGFQIGIAALLDDEMLADRISTTRPDIIRLEGGWLERAAGSEPIAALLRRFIALCHDSGAQVMLPCVRDDRALENAVDLQIDLVAGDTLGCALPAGAVMEFPRLPVAGPANVLRFRRRDGRH